MSESVTVQKKKRLPQWLTPFHVLGGAERIRTADLHAANVPLSQLSYCPAILLQVIKNLPQSSNLMPQTF
jgi:hypothetical protein